MADHNAQSLVTDLTPDVGDSDPVSTQELFVSAAAETTPPAINSFVPAVGTPLDRNQSVQFDVTDETSLLRAVVLVTQGDDLLTVHDGERFRGRFTNYSTRQAISGGFRYTVRPNGGWISAPTFEVFAVDTSGNAAS